MHKIVQFLNRFAGSTIQVLGMLNGEWSIIGGTGAFYNARGYIKYKEVPSTIISNITDIVRELDVHIFTRETSTVVSTARNMTLTSIIKL